MFDGVFVKSGGNTWLYENIILSLNETKPLGCNLVKTLNIKRLHPKGLSY